MSLLLLTERYVQMKQQWIWSNMDYQVLHKLVESLSVPVQTVIKAKKKKCTDDIICTKNPLWWTDKEFQFNFHLHFINCWSFKICTHNNNIQWAEILKVETPRHWECTVVWMDQFRYSRLTLLIQTTLYNSEYTHHWGGWTTAAENSTVFHSQTPRELLKISLIFNLQKTEQ